AFLLPAADQDDVGLRRVALRRRRQRAGAKEPQQRGLDRARQKSSMHAMAGNSRELREPRQAGIDSDRLAEAFGELILDLLGGGRDLLLHRDDLRVASRASGGGTRARWGPRAPASGCPPRRPPAAP